MPRFVVIARDPLIAAEGAAARLPAGIAVERRYAADLGFDEVFAHLGMQDLFAAEKAYHYVDFLELKLNKSEGERFALLLQGLPEGTTLVCSQVLAGETRGEEERLLKRQDFQRVADGAQLDDLRGAAEGSRAAGWVVARAKARYGMQLSAAQAARLFTAAGESAALADTELKKLAALKSADGLEPVAEEVLAASLSLSPAARFYELADAALRRDPRLQSLLAQWFRLEPETYRLISELKRRLLGLRALEQNLKVQPPYFEQQLRAIQRLWPPARLHRAIIALAELEHRLKSGLAVGESSQDAELTALQIYLAELA